MLRNFTGENSVFFNNFLFNFSNIAKKICCDCCCACNCATMNWFCCYCIHCKLSTTSCICSLWSFITWPNNWSWFAEETLRCNSFNRLMLLPLSLILSRFQLSRPSSLLSHFHSALSSFSFLYPLHYLFQQFFHSLLHMLLNNVSCFFCICSRLLLWLLLILMNDTGIKMTLKKPQRNMILRDGLNGFSYDFRVVHWLRHTHCLKISVKIQKYDPLRGDAHMTSTLRGEGGG